MTSDKPRRPGSIAGDVERTFARHKTNTPTGGVPVIMVEVDEELTPPPMPLPPEVAAMEVDEQLKLLRASAQEQAHALARVWDSRDLNDNVVAIGQDVATLTALTREFMMPAVKSMQGRLDLLEQARHAEAGRQARFWEHEWPAAIKHLEAIAQHMGRIEKDVDRVERNLDGYIQRKDAHDANVRADLAELKDELVKKEARIRSLEDFALSIKSKVALVSAGVGGGGAGLMWLVHHFLG